MGNVAAEVIAGLVDADAWAPFGWLPVEDTDPQDALHGLTFTWGDPHLNVISHSADEVEHRQGALHCNAMYRHDTHSQALLVLDADAVLAVAPPGTVFRGPADTERIRAFLLHPLDVVVLHPGTWHWGPFPIGADRVRLLNLQGRRYLEDNTRVDLQAAGAALDVRPAG